MSIPITYNKLVNVLNRLPPRPPRIEVWIRDYLPSGQVLKVVLKDLPALIYALYTNLPGTEEIYLLSREDFSMEMAEILRNAGIPVFGPGGEILG